MDESSDMEKADEVVLPGFRFHPTDEELVSFYLKRKIQQKPLPIDLIRQLDIYKYDPWDLPKLATTGEKEWYFYCQRDRKYRNSARPNRVTGAGFWKATGTDRPIYSTDGTKCIGLKKSLVIYRDRAAKGIKTDWMMHEFRLPSLTNTSLPKRPLDRHITANDSWAICRIFKKTNSMAQALAQSWASALSETTESDSFSVFQTMKANQFGSENISCTTEAGSSIQSSSNNGHRLPTSGINYPLFDATTCYKPDITMNFKSYPVPVTSAVDISASFMFPASEMPMASMLLNLSPSMLGEVEKSSASIDFVMSQQCNGFSGDQFPLENNGHLGNGEEEKTISNTGIVNSNLLGTMKAVSFPFGVPPNNSDEWKLNLPWVFSP